MSKVKNALIITSEFPPLPGGIGNHAYALAKYLQNACYQVSNLTDFRAEKEDTVFDAQQKIFTSRVSRTIFTPLKRIIKAFSLAKNNSIIICSGKFPLWIGGLLKVFFQNKKIIAVLHGSEIKAGGNFSQSLTRWSLKQFDEVIAVSNFTKEMALKVNPKLEIEVINNGFEMLESNSFSERKQIQGNPKIITVGNLTFRKGQQNVINALPILKNTFPEIHYHCIGIPTEIKDFQRIAEQLDVAKNVSFHGALATDELVSILNDSDVFVMLSDILDNGDFEGFGIAILEANALGKPAIGSNNSGISDAIKSGFSGELVDPKNKEEISQALNKIMRNYEFYAANAIQWSKEFAWDKVGRKYIQILER